MGEDPVMNVFRIRYTKLGKHYHCRVFSARGLNQTFAKNGDLVFDDEEFENVKAAMPGVEFIDEGEER